MKTVLYELYQGNMNITDYFTSAKDFWKSTLSRSFQPRQILSCVRSFQNLCGDGKLGNEVFALSYFQHYCVDGEIPRENRDEAFKHYRRFLQSSCSHELKDVLKEVAKFYVII